MDLETQVGPLTTKLQYNKILDLIEIAKSEGAERLLGGQVPDAPELSDGWFVEPTIFGNVNNQMRIAQEEVFGPVLSIIPFDDDEEAISIANDIVYGLAAGVWTTSIPRTFKVSEKLQAGIVWINTYRAVSYYVAFRRL